MEGFQHHPVLQEPVLEYLTPHPGGTYVDATLGGGSYSEQILRRLRGEGRVIGIDLDPDALQAASHKLKDYTNFRAVQGNFSDLEQILANLGIPTVDGVVFDLGVSSYQLDTPQRGFSFRGSGPLDMRFGPTQPLTAEHLINTATERELERIFKEYGEERWAGVIARRIVSQRTSGRITTTSELAGLVSAAIPRRFHPPRIHPATRVFQALRIAVNQELDSLTRGLQAAADCLTPGGRVCCVSYHSLEDRIAKRTFLRLSGTIIDRPPGLPRGMPAADSPPPILRILTRQPLLPSEDEVATNPRSRSARLRAAEKVLSGL